MNKEQLLMAGFQSIGTNSKGFELLARLSFGSPDNIVLHKIDKEGLSLGIEYFEKETVELLFNSPFFEEGDTSTQMDDGIQHKLPVEPPVPIVLSSSKLSSESFRLVAQGRESIEMSVSDFEKNLSLRVKDVESDK